MPTLYEGANATLPTIQREDSKSSCTLKILGSTITEDNREFIRRCYELIKTALDKIQDDWDKSYYIKTILNSATANVF